MTEGNIDFVKFLLTAGASPDLLTYKGNVSPPECNRATALYIVSFKGGDP